MKYFMRRFISFVLVCITLLSFGASIACASGDILMPEEAFLQRRSPRKKNSPGKQKQEMTLLYHSQPKRKMIRRSRKQQMKATSSQMQAETQASDAGDIALSTARKTSAHGCGYEQSDFCGMCRTNYQTIINIFTSTASSNWGNAYTAAATFLGKQGTRRRRMGL